MAVRIFMATGFVISLVLLSLLAGVQRANAAGRGLSDMGDTNGRRLTVIIDNPNHVDDACRLDVGYSYGCDSSYWRYPACCHAGYYNVGTQNYSNLGYTCEVYGLLPEGLAPNCNPAYPRTGCCKSGPSKSKCFPAAALVETPHGKKVMSSLSVGDKVLSVDSSTGRMRFETVYMFSHYDSDASAHFVALRTSANTTIRLTPGHYIWATPAAAAASHNVHFPESAAIRKPEELSSGDFVWMRTPSGDQVQPVQVTEVAHELSKGLFNPHVLGGTIVVDEVATLAFPSTLFPSVAAHRALILPVGLLYSLFPSDDLAMRFNLGILQMLGKANRDKCALPTI